MRPRVGIIGGGYSGAAFAIHLSRTSALPLDITIVEPSAGLGRGVAYGTTDPDHRTNGPTTTHSLYPDDPMHFDRWFRGGGGLAADPECLDPQGRIFPRRGEMGRYVGDELSRHQADNPSGSSIRHIRDRAVDTVADGDLYTVKLAGHDNLVVDLLAVTTSNAPPALLAPFRGAVAAHPAFYPDPWDLDRLSRIPADARILIIGTGLTMADVALVVLRDRPEATVTALSRRGLMPQNQRQAPAGATFLEIMSRAAPAFVARHGRPDTARAILRALRADARAMVAAGGEWQEAFDDVRDAAHQLWPLLSDQEQSRFVRHLWPWYETRRFRYPPQVDAKIQGMTAAGRLISQAAAVVDAAPKQARIEVTTRRRGQGAVSTALFDAVINCTGPERKPSPTGDPFLQNLVSGGLLVNHPLGLGLRVDELCRAQNSAGRHAARLRVIGPLARGRLGESNGVPHTALHIMRVLPDILAELEQVVPRAGATPSGVRDEAKT